MLKEDFLDRFFPLEGSEKKTEEFMSLRQRGMSVQEFSLKFTQHSKYAPTMVAKNRDMMNKFVMGVSTFVEKEFHTKILFNYIDIFRLMVYARQIEKP